MNTNKFNRYSYKELLAASTAPGAQQIDVDTLGAWFEAFGASYWNGECYDADGRDLFPVYGKPNEDGDVEISGYELR